MEYASYTLQPLGALSARYAAQPRQGVLLRSEAGGIGALQTWPEFGDAPLEYELSAIAEGAPLRVGRRTLHCMDIDAKARAEGKSLFEGLSVPNSHATLTITATPGQVYKLHQRGFRMGKLKLLPRLEASLDRLINLASMVPSWKWRLDFNATLTPEKAFQFWEMMPAALKKRIDFIEDPCCYEVSVWQALQDAGMPLAYDMPLPNNASRPPKTNKPMMRMVKPALHSSDAGRPVFTSYLDHPIGQCWAAFCAAKYYQKKPHITPPLCGLVTQHVYQPNAFSLELGMDISPVFTPPAGTGLGFDKILEGLEWKKL